MIFFFWKNGGGLRRGGLRDPCFSPAMCFGEVEFHDLTSGGRVGMFFPGVRGVRGVGSGGPGGGLGGPNGAPGIDALDR